MFPAQFYIIPNQYIIEINNFLKWFLTPAEILEIPEIIFVDSYSQFKNFKTFFLISEILPSARTFNARGIRCPAGHYPKFRTPNSQSHAVIKYDIFDTKKSR